MTGLEMDLQIAVKRAEDADKALKDMEENLMLLEINDAIKGLKKDLAREKKLANEAEEKLRECQAWIDKAKSDLQTECKVMCDVSNYRNCHANCFNRELLSTAPEFKSKAVKRDG